MEVIKLIMDIKDIIMIIVGCFLVLLYIVLVGIAIVKKRKQGEPVDIGKTMAEIAQQVLPLVGTAEIAFKSVSDKKTGTLKLKDVLHDIKDMCMEQGIIFDKEYWTKYVNEAVNLINVNRTSQEITEDNIVDKIADIRDVAKNHSC